MWPAAVAVALRASWVVRGSAEGLLDFLQSSRTSQKRLWLLGGRSGSWWVLPVVLRSSPCSVAVQAKVEASAARWRSSECREVVQLGWNGLGRVVEVFEVSG